MAEGQRRAAAFASLIDRVARLGALPGDPEDDRIRKASLTLASLVIIPLATVWVVTYWALGEPLGAAAPLTYQVVSLASLVVFLRTKRYRFFRASEAAG